MATSNRERVGRALELLATGLDPFIQRVVEGRLPPGKDWTLVLAAKDSARGIAKDYARHDVQNQLRVLTERLANGWFPFDEHLSRTEKALATELRETRNRWAHNDPFNTDDTIRALDSTERLLRAAGAVELADKARADRVAAQRAELDNEIKRAARNKTSHLNIASEGLPPWREVLRPHPDVESGNYAASEFAADLHIVSREVDDSGTKDYTDPVQFFRRTYVTDGLRDLLARATARVAGDRNAEPIINLQTNFGGGKTHSMLAVWHLFSGMETAAYPQEVQDAIAGHDLANLGKINRVALVGNQIPPGHPIMKQDGTEVHTLWGELAYQLGGREGYDIVAGADQTATNPGGLLDEVLTKFGPSVILIDEWVSYARQLHSRDDLCGGTFATQFTFAQALTEAIKRVPGSVLLVSIPSSDVRFDADDQSHDASDLEIGGAHGHEALKKLQNVVGRIAYQWRPATSVESFEIVRRRLFLDPTPEQRTQIGVTAKKFVEFYREHSGEFPRETREAEYETRIKQAYPIHPELFDRLYEDWSSLERFQRTRGVLRLMSAVVSALWKAGDQAPLIMPGSLPLDALGVRDEITQYLEDQWKPILDADIDGDNATPQRIDDERPLFKPRALTRRIARSVFMGSAPRLRSAHKGIERQRVYLGVAQPGDTVGNFGSALQMLGDRATYFYVDGESYWYDVQPSLNRMAKDRAEALHEEDVWEEIIERVKRRERTSTGHFSGVLVAPETTGEIPDLDGVRLAILHPKFDHAQRSETSTAYEFVQELIASRGNAPRERRNTLVALAADRNRREELFSAVRNHLGWISIVKRIKELNLTQQQASQAERRQTETSKAVDQRIPTTYIWAFYPEQPDGAKPLRLTARKVEGTQDHLAVRTGKRLVADDVLRVHTSARNIRMDLDYHLRNRWNDGRIALGELWSYYTKYPYLPRLRDRRVLDNAVREVLTDVAWTDTGFALAAGYDPDSGDFAGLAVPAEDDFGQLNDSTLLVAPHLAAAQRERERLVVVGGDDEGPDPIEPGPVVKPRPVEGRRTDPEPEPVQATRNARFQARFAVDAGSDIETQLASAAREVLEHLARSRPEVLDITLTVESERIDGFDDTVVRTVSENARTLGFSQNRFEDGR